MSVSGSDIRLDVGRTLNAIEKGEVLREVATSANAQNTYLTDTTRLLSSAFTPQQFMNRIVRVNDKFSTAGAAGSLSIARDLAPATGVLNVSPAFSAVSAAGDTMELWAPGPYHPDDLDRARDRALSQRCTRWRLNPITWLADGDLVASGVTSWQTASATPAKQVASGVERFVEQYLQVSLSALNGYVYQTVNCEPGDEWTFYMNAQAGNAGATAVFTAYDLTNGAPITLAVNAGGLITSPSNQSARYTGREWTDIFGSFTIPAGCTQFSYRLGGAAATDIVNWANLVLYPTGFRSVPLPRAVSTTLVGLVYELRNVNEWPLDEMVPVTRQPAIFDVGGGYVRLQFNTPTDGKYLFWQEFAYWNGLQTDYTTAAGRKAGDTATTNCDLQYAKWATLFELDPVRWEQRWRWADATYGARKIVRRVYSDPRPAISPVEQGYFQNAVN